LDAFILNRIPSSQKEGNGGEDLPRGYLAQSDLLDSSPQAMAHVPDLDHYLSGPRGDVFRRTIWIGPSGSWTPFHKDPYIGIYNQSKWT
jgi:lysine-specific demethylase 8